MAKKGRKPIYQSDEERPVTISLRLPHDLYEQLQRYAQRHRQSVTELVKDGIQLRLEVQADPRWQTPQADIAYYDDTVLQELATPAHFLDDGIPFDDDHLPAPALAPAPIADISYGSNAVIQETAPQRPRRKAKESPSQEVQSPALAEDPVSVAQTHNGNTSLQETATQHRGRKPVLREPILALLRDHPTGLTAEQLKVYLKTDKPIGDTLSGMVKAQLLTRNGSGKGVRYLCADLA